MTPPLSITQKDTTPRVGNYDFRQTWTPKQLRDELRYLKKKRRFIKRAGYLPMTTHNYQLAANKSYRGVISVSPDHRQMKLHCGHWQPVPQSNPLPAQWMRSGHRFCGACADRKYKEIMLGEIAESEKRVRSLLDAYPWRMRFLTWFVVLIVATGLGLTAFGVLRGNPRPVGAFDPRSDAYSDGSCP